MRKIKKGDEIFSSLIFRNYINTTTAMVRKKCYLNLGTLNEGIAPTGRDWEMWLRIALYYDIGFLCEPLACERDHKNNITNYFRQTNINVLARYIIIKTVFASLPHKKKHLSSLEPQVIKRLAKETLKIAGNYLSYGEVNLARKNIGLALAIDESISRDWRMYVLFLMTFLGRRAAKIAKALGPFKSLIKAVLFPETNKY